MMKQVFKRTEGLKDKEFSYCGGCLHSLVHRIIAELLEELGLLDKTIGICPVGCAVFMYDFINTDMIEAAHGRAPAVATGVKRCNPDKFVFTYQGDGDLASIGMAEIIHAAARGENYSAIFINNGIYGMTGGQMAPTTLVEQKATTCQLGRNPEFHGMPIKVCEMLATLDEPVYLTRVAPINPAGVIATKKAIKTAFENQINGKGFSLVEILANCPTQWGVTPVESIKWIEEKVKPVYPTGVIKVKE